MRGMSNSGRPYRDAAPFALVICGVPASGKSTLAGWAERSMGLPTVNSDKIRKELAQIKPSDRASPEHYSASFSQRVYAELGRRAAARICSHGRVIVDATFRSRQNREAFAGAFKGAAPILFVECCAPLDVLLARAEARDRDPARISDANAEIVASQHSQWQPLDEVQSHQRVVIDTTLAVEQIWAELTAAIQEFLIRTRTE